LQQPWVEELAAVVVSLVVVERHHQSVLELLVVVLRLEVHVVAQQGEVEQPATQFRVKAEVVQNLGALEAYWASQH
jgi:hypothetical protein